MLVRFEFHGGCKTGAIVVGQHAPQSSHDTPDASVYLFLTDGGRLGARFREPLPVEAAQARRAAYVEAVTEALRAGRKAPTGKYPPDYHVYEVTDRQMGPQGLTVRVEYVGEEQPDRTGSVASLPGVEDAG